MSTNLQIGSIDYGNLIAGDGPLVNQSDTLAAGAEHVAGEVLGRVKLAVGTPVKGQTNTGDGTVTGFALGKGAKIGNYQITCLDVAPTLALDSVTDGVGNAGKGTINPVGITVGADALAGDYVLTCLSANSELVAGTPVPSATAVMESITLGPKAQEGDYVCTCLTADGAPTWQVRSPAGGTLPVATNGVPYSNPQINFTITNPASPGDTITLPVTRSYTGGGVWQVVDPNGDRLADATTALAYEGGGLGFTIAAGSASFEPGDIITVTVTAGEGEGTGAWSVTDPDGIALRNATAGVAYTGPVKFTVAEGDTAFQPGDSFTLPVVAGSGLLKLVDKAAKDGSQNPIGILAAAVDATEADTACVIYRSGKFNSTKLVCATGTSYTDLKDALAELCIYARASL